MAGERAPSEDDEEVAESSDPADEEGAAEDSVATSSPDADTPTDGDADPPAGDDEGVDGVADDAPDEPEEGEGIEDGSGEPTDEDGDVRSPDSPDEQPPTGDSEAADEEDGPAADEAEDSPEEDDEEPPEKDEDDAPEEDGGTGSEDDDPSPAGEVASAFGGGLSGPEDDREMPLTAHIEEMLRRLAAVVAVAGLVTLFVFPFAEDVINFLWYSILPGVESDIARPRLYGVLELVFTELKVASLAGVIIGLPVLVYETYAFMRPGLYPNERRYYLAAIPTSLVLAVVGVSFAYFVILPAIFVYFLYYSQDVAAIGFALGRTFDLVLLLMGYMAIVFQIPLFVMLAMMMGLTSRAWLADKRLLFWGAFLGISFLFSPDPTGMAPIVVAATMIVLFEGSLLLAKWTGRG